METQERQKLLNRYCKTTRNINQKLTLNVDCEINYKEAMRALNLDYSDLTCPKWIIKEPKPKGDNETRSRTSMFTSQINLMKRKDKDPVPYSQAGSTHFLKRNLTDFPNHSLSKGTLKRKTFSDEIDDMIKQSKDERPNALRSNIVEKYVREILDKDKNPADFQKKI